MRAARASTGWCGRERSLPSPMNAPDLVFAYGNPSRGDDALGPAFLERVADCSDALIELITDFQLQPEHALDLVGRRRVLFVDASVSCAEPYEVVRSRRRPRRRCSATRWTPGAARGFRAHRAHAGAAAWALAIRGYGFELGEPLIRSAGEPGAALAWARGWLALPAPIK